MRTKQRLCARSDVERFTYESCRSVEADEAGTLRTMGYCRGTLRLRPITENDRCLAEWSSVYDCPNEDAEHWARWWATALPTWLTSLRDHLGRTADQDS